MQNDAEALLAVVRDSAEAEIAAIEAQAEEKIAAINAEVEAEIERLRSDAMSRLKEHLSRETDRLVSTAKLEIRNRLIDEKNKALNEVFESARRKLEETYNSGDGEEIFRRLVKEAVNKAGHRNLSLLISKEDIKFRKSLKSDFPTLTNIEMCDGPKGMIIVKSGDGSTWIDNGLEARLNAARDVMRQELGRFLFTDRSSGADVR